MTQNINATIRGKQSNIPYEKKVVVLGGNMVGGKNILTQDMLLSENTKYIIKWAFDLNTNTITMPVGSALEFNGGSINNGTIVINDTSIYPSYSSLTEGSNLTVEGNPSVGTYNFVEGLPVWWNGSEFIEADIAKAGVNRSGTFVNKPAATDIYVGFRYFCTDKQTTEGATDGIEIIHKGNDVWVDALGRVVS